LFRSLIISGKLKHILDYNSFYKKRFFGYIMIIGLVGTLASGKGVLADYFCKKGFYYYKLSDVLRKKLKEEGKEITRTSLQDKGDELRKKFGNAALAKEAIKEFQDIKSENFIIDGVRNPGEIEELKKVRNFFLVGIDAPVKLRFERAKGRGRESATHSYKRFLEEDKRDKGINEPKNGQSTTKCMKKANYMINNDKSLEELNEKVEQVYLDMNKKLKRPDWDEYFLGMVDKIGERATCNRGKSGCLITKENQILVTGYVGSPAGLPHCDDVGHQLKKTIHEDGHITEHCVRTIHAEQNAICQAAKFGISLRNSTLYCTMTPCTVCARLIINCGIKRVVCKKKYKAGEETEQMFKKVGVKLDFMSEEIMKY
jgi:dCMP deaminase